MTVDEKVQAMSDALVDGHWMDLQVGMPVRVKSFEVSHVRTESDCTGWRWAVKYVGPHSDGALLVANHELYPRRWEQHPETRKALIQTALEAQQPILTLERDKDGRYGWVHSLAECTFPEEAILWPLAELDYTPKAPEHANSPQNAGNDHAGGKNEEFSQEALSRKFPVGTMVRVIAQWPNGSEFTILGTVKAYESTGMGVAVGDGGWNLFYGDLRSIVALVPSDVAPSANDEAIRRIMEAVWNKWVANQLKATVSQPAEYVEALPIDEWIRKNVSMGSGVMVVNNLGTYNGFLAEQKRGHITLRDLGGGLMFLDTAKITRMAKYVPSNHYGVQDIECEWRKPR